MSALRLTLSPSPRLAALILAAHAAAGAAAWLSLPGWGGAAAAAAFVALGAAAAWSRALLRSAHSARTLELQAGKLAVDLAGGARLEAETSGYRYVSPFLVTLSLKGRTVLVTQDMLGRASFRLLRLWALWGRLPAVAGEQLRP